MIKWDIKSVVFANLPNVFYSFDRLVVDYLHEDKIRTNWSQVIEYRGHKFYFNYDSRFNTFEVNVPNFGLQASTPLNDIQPKGKLAEEFQNICDLLIAQSVHDS
jgi:hypothetical protein